MKFKEAIILTTVFLISCQYNSNTNASVGMGKNISAANKFIDAFYSFNSDKLNSVLENAEKSKPSILYYQGWAEGGNYEIIDRHPCLTTSDSIVVCPVTVKDDLIETLEIDFYVTDTFHITVKNDLILSVNTSSDDPQLYHQAREWVRQNRPKLIEIPCQGIWEGGPTPGVCVQAMVKGYSEFIEAQKSIE